MHHNHTSHSQNHFNNTMISFIFERSSTFIHQRICKHLRKKLKEFCVILCASINILEFTRMSKFWRWNWLCVENLDGLPIGRNSEIFQDFCFLYTSNISHLMDSIWPPLNTSINCRRLCLITFLLFGFLLISFLLLFLILFLTISSHQKFILSISLCCQQIMVQITLLTMILVYYQANLIYGRIFLFCYVVTHFKILLWQNISFCLHWFSTFPKTKPLYSFS